MGEKTSIEFHPLEPLTREEVESAIGLCRTQSVLSPKIRFEIVILKEPSKEALAAWEAQKIPPAREAFLRILDNEKKAAFEAVVDLKARQVIFLKEIPGVQPRIMLDEFGECEEALKADPRFQEAITRRGLDLKGVMVDPWGCGHYGFEEEKGKRLARMFCWYKTSEHDNGYARPIEGLEGLVDLHEMKVLEVKDHGVIPLPSQAGNFGKDFIKNYRKDLKPLQITQPEGPSFRVTGHLIEWQKWKMRVSFNAREGLVLHTVGYEDQGKTRPILHRASLSEIVVPYGEPRSPHYRKNAFDVGEYGMGMMVNSLKRGCDCLGEIFYFDALLTTSGGEVVNVPNAICLHEEDFGILWKHTDRRTDEAEVRRSRRLVVSFIGTVDNYDYGFYWYFYLNGTIQFEVKLTGILNTAALPPGTEARHGTLAAPQLDCQIHQHFFNCRLDFDIDGTSNSVEEIHFESLPFDDKNPFGNGFQAVTTPLKKEQEAQRTTDPRSDRSWRIFNPNRRNKMDRPTSYQLIAHEHALPYAHADSPIMKRAAFTQKHLWVTPFSETEMFAAGDYPNQHPGRNGLPLWTAANRSIENTDLVVWHTFGKSHLPRLEDWPVMPVEYTGFTLKPNGFFDENPTLDVPPEKKAADSCCHKT